MLIKSKNAGIKRNPGVIMHYNLALRAAALEVELREGRTDSMSLVRVLEVQVALVDQLAGEIHGFLGHSRIDTGIRFRFRSQANRIVAEGLCQIHRTAEFIACCKQAGAGFCFQP